MSRSPSCVLDDHHHEPPVEEAGPSVPGDRPYAGRNRKLARAGGFLALAEVRWAALSLLMFALNGQGALRVRVGRAAAESVVARIVALVEEASATKATTQLLIERVEQRCSVAMVSATVALFVVPLALGATLQPTLLRAMTFMIDAPALAAATLGMAMGRHGSDLALETADIVIVRDELATVPAAIALSRQARRVVTTNLVFAATVIVALASIDLRSPASR